MSERLVEPAPSEDADFPTLFDVAEFGQEAVAEITRGEGAFAALAKNRAEGEAGPPLRLRRIRLTNVLGFEDATIYPDDFTVLVGANNSGKSSLMRAVTFAQTLMRIHVERQDDQKVVLARGRNLDDSLLLPVPEVRDLWYRGIRRVGQTWVMAEIEVTIETGLTIGFGMKGPIGHATSRLSSRLIARCRAVFDGLSEYPIVYVPSSVGVVDHEEYRTPARILSLISGGRAHEVLRNLLFDLQQEGRLGEVSKVIAEYFSGSVEQVSFDPLADDYIHVYYREDSDHDLFSAGRGSPSPAAHNFPCPRASGDSARR